jgi:iron complex transport system substrate-binding protein
MGNNGHTRALHFTHPPRRIVSLVPSYTESLFDLGFGEAVVGVTDFCIYPAQALQGLPRLGGPKNPRVNDILELEPDLVLANWEENTLKTVEALEAAGIRVWVTFPKTVRQALDMLWLLIGVFHSTAAAAKLETLELALDWAISAGGDRPPVRYFCPVWQDKTADGLAWWMTFNQDTYSHDLLGLLGGQNIFAERQRRYPLMADLGLAKPQKTSRADNRYPRVTLEEIREADPELIILPSEPFSYSEEHLHKIKELFSGTTAIRQQCVYLVDGSLITWHGTRLAHALQELPGLFSGRP